MKRASQRERKRPRLLPQDPNAAYTAVVLQEIRGALPSLVDARRERLLPKLVMAWANRQFKREQSRPVSRREKRSASTNLKKLERSVKNVKKRLLELDDFGKWSLARAAAVGFRQFGEGLGVLEVSYEQIELLQLHVQRLGVLAEGASLLIDHHLNLHPRRGGPERDLPKQEAVTELAEIFEFVTGKRAQRLVHGDGRHRNYGKDYGPFWNFVVAVWTPLYRSERGLSDRLKRWEYWRKHGIALSGLFHDLNREYPQWGLLRKDPKS